MSGFTIPEIEPRLFSFNNPFGACPNCDGLGVEQQIDPDLVVPDKDAHAARAARSRRGRRPSLALLRADARRRSAKHYKFTLDTKWKDLPKKAQDAILYGSGDDEIRFTYDDGMRAYETKKPFEGVIDQSRAPLASETESDWAREEIANYFPDVPVRRLQRLSPQARGAVRQDRRPAHRRGLRAVDQARAANGSRRCRRTSPSSRTRSRRAS